MSVNVSASRTANLARLASDTWKVEPGQEYVIDAFKPEDALAVTRCVYDVFGDGHPFDYVYDPEGVAERFTSGEHYTAVARTERGDVLGMIGLYRSAPWQQLYEIGQVMIMRDCRDASMGLKLCSYAAKELAEISGARTLYAETVCTHVFTQYAGRKNKFVECGLELEIMPAKVFDPHDAYGEGRVSLLLYSKVLDDAPHAVHLPAEVGELAGIVYRRLQLDREIREEVGELPPLSDASVSTYAEIGLSRLNVAAPGQDIISLAAEAERAIGHGAVQVFLNLADPATPAAFAALRARGYFLGAVLPNWFGTDGLLVQRLSSSPNFDVLRIGSKDGKEIMRLVKEDMERVAASGTSHPEWGAD